MAKLGSLFVSLGLDLTDFKRGFKDLNRMQNTLTKTVRMFRTGFIGFGGAYAINAAIKGLANRSWEFRNSVEDVKSEWGKLLDKGIKPILPYLTEMARIVANVGRDFNEIIDRAQKTKKEAKEAKNFVVAGMFWSPVAPGTKVHPTAMDRYSPQGPDYNKPIGPLIGMSSKEIQEMLKKQQEQGKKQAEFAQFMQMQIARGGMAPGSAGFEKRDEGVDYLKRMAKWRQSLKQGIEGGGIAAAKVPDDVMRNFEKIQSEIERAEMRFQDFAFSVKDHWAQTIEGMLSGTIKFGQVAQRVFQGVWQSYLQSISRSIAESIFERSGDWLRNLPGLGGGGTTLAGGGGSVNIGTLTLQGNDARTLQAIINKNAKRRVY